MKTAINLFIIIIIIISLIVLDKALTPKFRFCVKVVVVLVTAFSHLAEHRRTVVNMWGPQKWEPLR
jgi:hypothetical protein